MAIVEAAEVALSCTNASVAVCVIFVRAQLPLIMCSRARPAPLLPIACCSPAPFPLLQERIRQTQRADGVVRSIYYAASDGNIAVAQDHLLVNPACVNVM